VWTIVGERLRATLEDEAHAVSTAATLADVAEHALDPYAAADRLLATIDRRSAP
jgi:hypothetical protein